MSASLTAQLLALQTENATLKQQTQTLKSERAIQREINSFIQKVQAKAFIFPHDVKLVGQVYDLLVDHQH